MTAIDSVNYSPDLYHKFECDGNVYLLNVEEMTYVQIDETTTDSFGKRPLDSPFPVQLSTSFGQSSGFNVKEECCSDENCCSINSINLFITQTCNLACSYCYGEGGEYGQKSHMTEKHAFQTVDWLIYQSKEKKNLSICFFGGEPLLNISLLKRVIDYARTMGEKKNKTFTFGVVTNGILLDDENLRYFKEQNIAIQMSFDGPKTIQDKQRPFKNSTFSSYDYSISKIEKLLEKFPETLCRATLCEGSDPFVVREELRRLGFSRYQLVPVSKPDYLHKENGKHINKNLYECMKEIIQDESETFLDAVKNRYTGKVLELKGSFLLRRLMFSQHKNYSFCGAVRSFVAVSTSGDVYICHRFVGLEDYKIGNVFNTELKTEAYLKRSVHTVKKCSKCWARYSCGGGCMHDHFNATGSIFKPNEKMCNLKKFIIELSIHVCSQITKEDEVWLQEIKVIPEKPCYLDF